VFDRLYDLIIGSLRLFQFLAVVDAWERGVVLRFGRYLRTVEPGLVWLIPFGVDRVLTIPVVPDPEKLDGQTLTTSDGHIVTLRAVVTYRVKDARRALLEITEVKRSLEDACSGEIGRLVSEVKAEDLTASRFWSRLTRACQSRSAEWGIEILRVQLSDIAKSRNVRLWTESQAIKD
jgi:regulator of protease activity HflC (stomatin/prohibitin superfamily)